MIQAKHIVSGVFAGVILFAPVTAAFGQTETPAAPVNGAESSDTLDPKIEIPNVRDPEPGTRIPEQTYPCNPGGFEPAEDVDDPETPYAYDCTGVIHPPASHDSEMTVEPPDPNAGTLPIIEPDDIEAD